MSQNLEPLQTTPEIRTEEVTRYVTPLREGGSLPAIVEAADGFLYVLKFRGAGQGIKALVAEFIGGQIAKALQLKVPEIIFAQMHEAFGRTEPDEEIQDLLKASTGLNIGLHYLSGSITFDPAAQKPTAFIASVIVWLDAFIFNVDRTARNTNLLWWNKELWLIDHGAALFFHHNWENRNEYIVKPFVQIKDHVLLPFATELTSAHEHCMQHLSPAILQAICAALPGEFLQYGDTDQTPDEIRKAYADFLIARFTAAEVFLNHANHARQAII